MSGRHWKPEPIILSVISGWEFCALALGRPPTITNLVGRLPKLARRAVALSAGVWLYRHFD